MRRRALGPAHRDRLDARSRATGQAGRTQEEATGAGANMTPKDFNLDTRATSRDMLDRAFLVIPFLSNEADGILGYGHEFAIARAAGLLALIARISAAAASRLRAEVDRNRPLLHDADDPHQRTHWHHRKLEMAAINSELDMLLFQAEVLAGPELADSRAKFFEKVLRQDGYI